jgi:hypothetical protein
VASSLLAADLAVLTLFLNPEATLRRDGFALLLCLVLPYLAVGAGLLWLVGWAVRAARPPRPDARPLFARLPDFPGLALLALGAVTALFWFNLFSYRYSVPAEFLRALAAASVAVSACTLVLAAASLDARLFPHRGRGPTAALAILASAAAVAVPLALRPRRVPRPAPPPVSLAPRAPLRRVTLIGIDGLGASYLQQKVARGGLAGLARVMRRGAYGPLATLRPTEAPAIWTTIFTGRLPRDHGVKSFAVYRLRGSATAWEALPKGALVGLLERAGLVRREALTVSARERRALWNALNAFGISTGIVRFWGTCPPERVQGFMLGQCFHRGSPGAVLHPADLLEEARARAVAPADVDRPLLARFFSPGAAPTVREGGLRRELVEQALAPDLTYQRAGAMLRAAYDPPFFATYFYGLDVIGHGFTRFAEPDRFGNVRAEEVRRYGGVRDEYAEMLGRWVGEEAQALQPGEVLLVVSAYGMEPLPLWRRLLPALGSGTPRPSGTHAGAPDGVLLAMGDGIRAGAALRSASVLDLAPTILYLMGLPVARDMEGRVLTEMLEDELTRAHHLSFVPSYESVAAAPAASAEVPELPPLPDEP